MFKRKKKSTLTDLQVQQQEFDELFAMPTDEVIEQIDAVLQRRFPDYYASLNPGLTPQEITSFESQLGVTFPEDYKSLLRWKNGSQERNAPYWSGQFCGRERAIEISDMLMEVTREPKFGFEPKPLFDDINTWWNPGWVPLIGEYMSSEVLCLDTVGSFTGKSGQIIRFIHDAYYRPIKHESINRWLLTTYAMVLSEEFTPNEDTDREFDFSDIGEALDRELSLEKIANPGYPIHIGEF